MPTKYNVNVCIWNNRNAAHLDGFIQKRWYETLIALNQCKCHENSKSTKLLWNNMINASKRFENLWCVVWFIIAYVACFENHTTNGIHTQAIPNNIVQRCYCTVCTIRMQNWNATNLCDILELKQADRAHYEFEMKSLTLEKLNDFPNICRNDF